MSSSGQQDDLYNFDAMDADKTSTSSSSSDNGSVTYSLSSPTSEDSDMSSDDGEGVPLLQGQHQTA